MDVLKKIESLLKDKGLKKAEVAAALGIQRQNFNVSFKNPTVQRLEEMAAALGVPIWQLFVAPEEVAAPTDNGSDFAAFVRFDGVHLTADNWAEFWRLVDELESTHPRR